MTTDTRPTQEGSIIPGQRTETGPLFTRDKIEEILSTIPREAHACYTGQSILAYCPDPTFDWAELNVWPDETDVDFFCYNMATLSALVQRFMDRGWLPAHSIDNFKAERIRFWEPSRRFRLQTVALAKDGMPNVNLTWQEDSDNAMATIQRFDMDYLMVSMDIRTREFVDMRGPDHRIANVNRLNTKFDLMDVDVMYWLRQFDRIPKGYSRGIDTRPVAQTYIEWIDMTLDNGDRGAGSKTRFYNERRMENTIAQVVEAGFTKEQAEALYHLVRFEDNGWEGMRLNLLEVRKQIEDWLGSVSQD